MRHQFIDENRVHYPVRRLCRALNVSVSGYYAACGRAPSARAKRQAALIERIGSIHTTSRATYGAPRVHAELVAQAQPCCKNTVAQLMRRAGIVPKTVRRFRITTDSRHTKASPNLVGRHFTADQPNQCWLTDITFILTGQGWLYLAAILDLYSRAIVGWAMHQRLDGKLVMDAMHMALQQRMQAPKIIHSDQGTLYAMTSYRTLLAGHGIRQSMSRRANCWDNAPMESFFHTLKTELVMHCNYRTREQAQTSLFEYIEVFYNRQRRHSTLNYATPLTFETINRPLITVSTVRG